MGVKQDQFVKFQEEGIALNFLVPYGADPNKFFDELKEAYVEAVAKLRQKLNS
jgi:hypothetical protein